MQANTQTSTQIDPIYIGTNAVTHMVAYADQHALNRFALIVDSNTYAALGQHVEMALKARDYDVQTILLAGDIHADERRVVEVLIRAPRGEYTFISVGGGSITDITRFVSHRTGRAFIALPTAASVDGFTSIGAPLILNGVKTTIPCQPPLALFVDLDTLCNAPARLTAAGVGDMIGKITALADWQLGALLWDEPYDAGIAARTQTAIGRTLANIDAIAERTPDGLRALIESLIESGLCMLDHGGSRPASGAEHHTAHYWEMQRLQNPTDIRHSSKQRDMLHGEQVGYALLCVAERYTRLRKLTRSDALDRLEASELPNRDAEIAAIQTGYGVMADDVLPTQARFLSLDDVAYDGLKQRVANHWEKIQQIAASVLTPVQIKAVLNRVGAPATAAALGITEGDAHTGLRYAHYLRDRFTVLKLERLLALEDPHP